MSSESMVSYALAQNRQSQKPRQGVSTPQPCILQRKCACGGTPGLDGECAGCKANRLAGQGATLQSQRATSSQLSSMVRQVLSTPGEPLGDTRAYMEPRFGHDFSNVRVHTDARAAESARTLNAGAYTVGQDIVFGHNRYAPNTSEGRKLIAHELAHTIQQGIEVAGRGDTLEVSKPGDRAEREADSVAASVLRGEAAGPIVEGAAQLARQGLEEEAPSSGEQEETTSTGQETELDDEEEVPEGGEWVKSEEGLGIEAGSGPSASSDADAVDAGLLSAPDDETAEAESAPATLEGEAVKPEDATATPQGETTKPKGGTAKPAKAGKKVCFTFDDGPEPGTADVLNALSGKVSATFFLTGSNMAKKQADQKALVERMLKEGHQLGNHTFTHKPATVAGYKDTYGDLSDPKKKKKFDENYSKNEQHFKGLLGSKFSKFKLARLPGDGRVVKIGGKLVFVTATEGLGMAHVGWNFEFGTNGSFGHLKA
ncbi:MAG TPA: DUF4157 domain-containing protein, partial [Chloroflexia bacterium]|nr:DUF4157 domain-containing protein [Chloroflexia bacterium]